jgi:hypothetical protein
MTQARKTQISLSDTPYYHCMGRCVHRAFLCSDDPFTGKSYEHRKQWIVDKLRAMGYGAQQKHPTHAQINKPPSRPGYNIICLANIFFNLGAKCML